MTIDVPVSWLTTSDWYKRNVKGITTEDMRRRGYIINKFTWPQLRWAEGDR